MIFFYNLILIVLIVAFSPLIVVGIILNKKWRQDILERFCIYRQNVSFKDRKIIWFHAASVGEIQALAPILKELKKISNDYDFVVTTTSINGKKKIQKEMQELVLFSCFVPLDIYFFTDYFIKKIDPMLVVFIETELWPNLIYNIHERQVPLLLVNGRISDKSLGIYMMFSFLFRSVLSMFLLIVVQSEKMSRRFSTIGKIDSNKIIILPNTKFSVAQDAKTRYVISINRFKKIVVAGSIREGEEEIIIKAFSGLKNKSVLVIAPRYLNRVKKISDIIKKYDLKYELWTNIAECNKIMDYDIVILNTIGELTNFYSIGDVAVVGGGFKNFGGHNPIEPASFGLPVIIGKHMYNFEETCEKLTKYGGTIKVDSQPEKLFSEINNLIEDENLRKTRGEKNRKVVENFKSSVDATAILIKEILIDKKLHKERL